MRFKLDAMPDGNPVRLQRMNTDELGESDELFIHAFALTKKKKKGLAKVFSKVAKAVKSAAPILKIVGAGVIGGVIGNFMAKKAAPAQQDVQGPVQPEAGVVQMMTPEIPVQAAQAEQANAPGRPAIFDIPILGKILEALFG